MTFLADLNLSQDRFGILEQGLVLRLESLDPVDLAVSLLVLFMSMFAFVLLGQDLCLLHDLLQDARVGRLHLSRHFLLTWIHQNCL